MLSVPRLDLAGNILPRAHAYVFVRQYWADDWQFVPYLRPVHVHGAIAPEFGEAEFRYWFGSIKQQQSDAVAYAYYAPQQLLGWYVQVRGLVAGAGNQSSEPAPYWTGFFVRDRPSFGRGDVALGQQQLRAAGIGKLWDQKKIRTGYVYDTKAGGVQIEQTIGWAPDFNERVDRLGIPVFGNRSEDLAGDEQAYRFGRGATWSADEAVAHLLLFHSPPQFGDVPIVGDNSLLESMTGVWRTAGKSPWEALNHIMDRKFCVGWYFDVEADDQVVCRVFSTAPKAVGYGEFFLPAASERMSLSIPTTFPWSHLIDETPLDQSIESNVDRIIVRSNRIVTVATVHYANSDAAGEGFAKGWSADVETAYETASVPASDTLDEDELKKIERARDRYSRVFTAHVLQDGWLDRQPVYASAYDGAVDDYAGDGATGTWHDGKRLMRTLPLRMGVDYTGDSPADENAADADPEFLPLLVFYVDADDGPAHTANGAAYIVERMAELNPDLQSANVRALDLEPGIEVQATPRHYFALNHWDGETDVDPEPELDYESLSATVAWKSDWHAEVTVERPAAGDLDREIVIDVPDAEYWICAPGTVVDVKAGTPIKIGPNCRVLRDDTEHLRAVACFAQAQWFEVRQPIHLEIKAIVRFPLGALLDSLAAGLDSIEPNTIVTSWLQNWDQRITILETGYAALDAAGLAQAQQPLGRYKRAKTVGMRHA